MVTRWVTALDVAFMSSNLGSSKGPEESDKFAPLMGS